MELRDVQVYVAGPFRASDHYAIEKNIRKAEQLNWEVWAAGMTGLCPHANTRFYQGSLPDDVWLRGDLTLLRNSTAVLLVPGWENSSGTRAEIQDAMLHNIPIFNSLAELKEWAEGYVRHFNQVEEGRGHE